MANGPLLDNRLLITGRILKPAEIYYSPAGLPIARFSLEHHSQQTEAGIVREARCRIPVVACGEPLAPDTSRLPADTLIKISGFLARANYRQGEARLILHAQHIEILDNL